MSNYHSTLQYEWNFYVSLPYRLKLILAYKNLKKLKKRSLIWNCFKTVPPPRHLPSKHVLQLITSHNGHQMQLGITQTTGVTRSGFERALTEQKMKSVRPAYTYLRVPC